MKKYQEALHNTDAEIPQELQALALPLPQNEEMRCAPNASECLSEIKAKLPEYKQALYRYRDLIRNIDALADYENLYLDHPPGDGLPPFKQRLPQLNLLSYGRAAAAVEWADNQPKQALQRACRQIKLGKTLIQKQQELVYAMMGDVLVSGNTRLVAHMLSEKPEWATHLPETCTQALMPFTQNEHNICGSIKKEFRSIRNLNRQMGANSSFNIRLELLTKPENSWFLLLDDNEPFWPLALQAMTLPVCDTEHNEAILAASYAPFCRSSALQASKQDTGPVSMPEAISYHSWSCKSNVLGCRFFGSTLVDFSDYQNRLQDTQMLLRAIQAGLDLYRLPTQQRQVALNSILDRHSSPSRQLRWDTETHHITFPLYLLHPPSSTHEHTGCIIQPINQMPV